ncbi:MAG: hypothetical protein GKR90_14885 [Pseudomonadales bacterium]|nr:hypothetical protein [Pseudomonadales bacterium]
MPIYEYRCGGCSEISTSLRKVSESKDPIDCESCGAQARRIVSRPSVHLSNMSKVEKLDPKYDKMVDRAMKNTTSADPERILKKMKPLSDGK